MAKKLLENGFHVICEKPLTTTLKEAKDLQALQDKHQAIFAVTYTYTGYPMVREMKDMIAKGVIGDIHKVFTILSGMDQPCDSRQRKKE